jgi:ABC-type multidrug transport system permease subunit
VRWSSVVAAVIRRDWRIATSYRASFVLELGSIVFFLALFYYLGRLVSEEELAARESLSGDYFAFAAVGIALFRMVSLSLAGFAAKLREEQTTGTFEALMTAPVSPGLIVLASSAYDLLRGALSGLVVLLAAILIFGLDLDLAAGSLATATLAIVGSLGLFAAFGAAVAAVIVVLKRATALLGLALTALALLGGVYFPVDVLPAALEAIAEASPFTWALDVLRDSLLGGDVDPAQLVGLFAAVAVLIPLSLAAFGWALRRARRTGSLATY